jgi:hypothetical protein
MKLKKINKKTNLNQINIQNSWSELWDYEYSIESRYKKNHEAKFLIIQN